MGLDTLHRPRTFDDVLGQEATKKIMRKFVAEGKAFQQSYLLAGGFGSGKTTLARILARAMLCDVPTERGDPCDKCPTCQTFLSGGTIEAFTEFDAATNSGKEDILRLVESLRYVTFTGKRRLFLIDESHRLSHSALDAMLKPLEEGVLTCIFCTTEPEKMRETILSRCAPAFIVHPVDPQKITERLKHVCGVEGIEYEEEALRLIATLTESHIRDALKAVEGVAMLGPVNRANVTEYLHLDLNGLYIDVLENIGKDQVAALEAARSLLERTPAATAYSKLSSLAMAAYQGSLGVGSPPVFWDKDRVDALSKRGPLLLNYAIRFSERPGHPTLATLLCDISVLHVTGGQAPQEQGVIVVQAPAAGMQSPLSGGSPGPFAVENKTVAAPCAVENKTVAAPRVDPAPKGGPGKVEVPAQLHGGGTYVDPRAVRRVAQEEKPKKPHNELEAPLFCRLLGLEILEQLEAHGPTG